MTDTTVLKEIRQMVAALKYGQGGSKFKRRHLAATTQMWPQQWPEPVCSACMYGLYSAQDWHRPQGELPQVPQKLTKLQRQLNGFPDLSEREGTPEVSNSISKPVFVLVLAVSPPHSSILHTALSQPAVQLVISHHALYLSYFAPLAVCCPTEPRAADFCLVLAASQSHWKLWGSGRPRRSSAHGGLPALL